MGRRYVHVNERKGRYTVGDSTVGEENYRMKDEDERQEERYREENGRKKMQVINKVVFAVSSFVNNPV